jgi:hypothetical protein
MAIGAKRSRFASQGTSEHGKCRKRIEGIHSPLNIGIRIAAFCVKVTQLTAPGKLEVSNVAPPYWSRRRNCLTWGRPAECKSK